MSKTRAKVTLEITLLTERERSRHVGGVVNRHGLSKEETTRLLNLQYFRVRAVGYTRGRKREVFHEDVVTASGFMGLIKNYSGQFAFEAKNYFGVPA